MTPIDWFADYPLTAVIIIVAWQWLPFAFLILFTAIQSLEAARKRASTARRSRCSSTSRCRT